MERCYEFAGVRIVISAPPETIFESEGRLKNFAGTTACHRFSLEKADTLDEPTGTFAWTESGCRTYVDGDRRICYFGPVQQRWEDAHMRVDHQGTEHHVQLSTAKIPGRVGVHTLLSALGAEHLVVRAGGVILHASYIVHDGRAILFTAPSETGKSTQAELWRTLRDARIVNGDRAAIRMENGIAVACGIPFAGSSQYCENITAPLAAIVCLGQAPVTRISPLRGYQAFRQIWEGCSVNTWDQTDVEMAAGLLQRVLDQVPVFRLDCTPDESAVVALENMLKGQV